MEDDIAFKRIFERIDDIQEQINKLVESQAGISGKFDTHLLVGKELTRYKKEQEQILAGHKAVKRETSLIKFRKIVSILGVIVATAGVVIAIMI